MSGNKINNYSSVDSNITEMQLTEDASFIGLHTVSLTNYKTTTAPTIAAGSKVEVNGALYGFSSAETITGSPSDGVVYIIIIPAGATCTAQFTNTAPTWSDAKQGFYGTGGAATYRYLEYYMVKASASYTKYRMTYDDVMIMATIASTVGNITTLNSTTANITTANITTVNVSDWLRYTPTQIYHTTNTSDYFHNRISAIIPTGSIRIINGCLKKDSDVLVLNFIDVYDASNIRIYGMDMWTFTDGDITTYYTASFCLLT
jgi:hypothetical protein